MSRSTLLVGAPHQDSFAGAVYVYVRSRGTWVLQAQLPGPPGSVFGESVDISGSTAIIGAPGDDSYAGAAYVYHRTNGIWSERARLTAADGVSGDDFGSSVALGRDTIVVGAPSRWYGSGAAYLFMRTRKGWEQRDEIAAPEDFQDGIGTSVAVSGRTALVGVHGWYGPGWVLVFAVAHRRWSQQSVLMGSEGGFDWFGSRVALSGGTAVIGAAGAGGPTGAAYVFHRDGDVWTQQAELLPPDGFPTFGGSVSAFGSTAVVGAPSGPGWYGQAYVFDGSDGTWSSSATLVPPDHPWGDSFGESVLVRWSTAVVGAPDDRDATGAVYVFDDAGGTWSSRVKLTPDA